MDAGEYIHSRGDDVKVLSRTRKGDVVEKLATVKSYKEEDDTYQVVFLDNGSEGKVHGHLVNDSRKKYHIREDVVVACFSRIKDLENFGEVIDTLPTPGKLNVAKRLGWMNIFNAENPDGTYNLNFDTHEDRLMVNMIVKLSVVEDGVNTACPGIPFGKNFCNRICTCHWFNNEKCYLDNKRTVGYPIPVAWDDPKFDPPIAKFKPAWKSTIQKTKERALPTEGYFSTRFITTEQKNDELRRELNSRYCLVGTPVPERHPDKLRRELSYSSQKFDV